MAKKKKDVSTTAEGEDDLADVTKEELRDVDARRASADTSSHAFKGVQDPMQHPDWTTFRTDVENTAAGDLNWPPREPYPTGNPPDPEQEYAKINGFLPDEGGPGGIAGARDTPNPRANEGRHGKKHPAAKET